MNQELNLETVEQAADIVGAYVSHNAMSATGLPEFIRAVHSALMALRSSSAPVAPGEAQVAAVSIRKSITPDYLICLEDGRKFKSLRRHLRTAFHMTPEQYRAKWNLPADYPMVAQSYSASRSALAKSIGLGRKS